MKESTDRTYPWASDMPPIIGHNCIALCLFHSSIHPLHPLHLICVQPHQTITQNINCSSTNEEDLAHICQAVNTLSVQVRVYNSRLLLFPSYNSKHKIEINGAIDSKLLRYGVLAYLAGSVVFTLHTHFNQIQDSEVIQDLKPRALLEPGQAIFDVESIVYSNQLIEWKSPSDFPTHQTKEDAVIHKIFANTMQPSKVLPYYFKAGRKFDPEAVTITTLITFDRYPIFSKLVTNYQGPISVSIHVNDDENRDENLSKLHDMYNSNPFMKEFVDVHVVVDKFDRQFNMWRNVARFFARTNYFMMLDVDFHICTNLKHHLSLDPEAQKLMRSGAAVLLPAFEYVNQDDGIDSATFPKDKESAIRLVQEKKLTVFHDFFLKGHGATNYERWYKTDSVYKVTEYQHSYEPYVILKKEGTPWCDERFVGYGANKAACLFEIYISGIDYYVLPHDFLIHQSHPYKEETRKQERKYNRKLYQNFQEEVCFRYAMRFVHANLWDSPKANNLKEQCNKIRGFKQAMTQFSQL